MALQSEKKDVSLLSRSEMNDVHGHEFVSEIYILGFFHVFIPATNRPRQIIGGRFLLCIHACRYFMGTYFQLSCSAAENGKFPKIEFSQNSRVPINIFFLARAWFCPVKSGSAVTVRPSYRFS